MSVAVAVLAIIAVAALVGGPFGERDDTADPGDWPPPAEVVERGGAVYQQLCAVCHGVDGEGEPNWQTQNPDLTYPAPPHDESGHTWHHGDRLLFEIVRDGGGRFDSPTFRSRMPAFGDALADCEIRDVIVYLRTLWGPDERAFQEQMSELDPFPDLPRC